MKNKKLTNIQKAIIINIVVLVLIASVFFIATSENYKPNYNTKSIPSSTSTTTNSTR